MLTNLDISDIPSYKGVFEAHLTVNKLDKIQLAQFDKVSQELGVKSIQIELSRGDMLIQPMTCSTHQGDFQNIFQEVLKLAVVLQQNNFEVIRLKIEAHPNNIGVPNTNSELVYHSDKNYFEHHIKVLLNKHTNLDLLLEVCEKHQAHLSTNSLKKRNDNEYEKFITTRSYHLGKKETEKRFDALMKDVQNLSIPILKHFMEYCVFDTNIDLDKNWLSEKSPCINCNQTCMMNS